MKALFIDDDSLNNKLTEMLLLDAGFTDYNIFSSASAALEFLDHCRSSTDCPSFIFLDLNMPEMSGYEFLDIFLEKYAALFPHTKIILLSSAPEYVVKHNFEKYKIVEAYIEKPLKEAHIEKLF